MRALVYFNFLKEVRLGGWGSDGLTLGRHASACATISSCVRYYFWLLALLYKVACTTILGCVDHLSECATLMHALINFHFLKKARLGGWGQKLK